MIALIDYKAGNLTSVRKALAALGADVYSPDVADDLLRATAIIVPGVGHFQSTAMLDGGWHDTIRARVDAGIPLLGICLGMQLLFEGSSEAPGVPGLGLLAGRCVRLGADGADRADDADGAGRPSIPDFRSIKVPHVGWNALDQRDRTSRILEGVASGEQAYFTHSYVVPESEATAGWTTHGVAFPSVVERGRVQGVQFHPEKSGTVGLRMLRNFLETVR